MASHTTSRPAAAGGMKLLAVAAALAGVIAPALVALPYAARMAALVGGGAGALAFLLLHLGSGKLGREMLALALGVHLAAAGLTAVL